MVVMGFILLVGVLMLLSVVALFMCFVDAFGIDVSAVDGVGVFSNVDVVVDVGVVGRVVDVGIVDVDVVCVGVDVDVVFGSLVVDVDVVVVGVGFDMVVDGHRVLVLVICLRCLTS